MHPASSNQDTPPQPAAGPGAPEGTAALHMAIGSYLQKHHMGSWYSSLDIHVSIRPKVHGGALVRSVKACMTWEEPRPIQAAASGAPWKCTLVLPNCFAPDDQLNMEAIGEGTTKDKATEDACHCMMVKLFAHDPQRVVVRQAHWTIPIQDLVANIPRIEAIGEHAELIVLPPNWRRGGRLASESATERDIDSVDWADRVKQLLREILNTHGGHFDPSWTSRKWMGVAPGEETAYEKLNKLLKPGELKTFIDERCDSEFAWHHKGKGGGKRGMIVTWGSGGASAAASGAPAAASGAGHHDGGEVDDERYVVVPMPVDDCASASPDTGTPAAASGVPAAANGASGSASASPARHGHACGSQRRQ